MAKFEEFEEEEELFEDENLEVTVVQKEGFMTKIKNKVSSIGDITLRDVGKGALKVGGAIGGVALLVFGASKVFGGKQDNEDFIVTDDPDVFNEFIDTVCTESETE